MVDGKANWLRGYPYVQNQSIKKHVFLIFFKLFHFLKTFFLINRSTMTLKTISQRQGRQKDANNCANTIQNDLKRSENNPKPSKTVQRSARIGLDIYLDRSSKPTELKFEILRTSDDAQNIRKKRNEKKMKRKKKNYLD